MTKQFINETVNILRRELKPRDLRVVIRALEYVCGNYEMTKKNGKRKITNVKEYNRRILDKFLLAKKASGRSGNTIDTYRYSIGKFLEDINKPVEEIVSDDIIVYFNQLLELGGNSRATIKSKRLYLKSFFKYCQINDLIVKNPMDKIEGVKVGETYKRLFTEEDLVVMKEAVHNKVRDRAIVDLLNSSMIRVSELVHLDKSDIILEERELLVRSGKGFKDRIVYFDGETKIHIQEYLDSRDDDNEALFVSNKKPHKRLTKSGVEKIIHKLGETTKIPRNCTPHNFRRTGATRALRAGMTIDEVQLLLGHEQISTTQIYAKPDGRSIKLKYLNM